MALDRWQQTQIMLEMMLTTTMDNNYLAYLGRFWQNMIRASLICDNTAYIPDSKQQEYRLRAIPYSTMM